MFSTPASQSTVAFRSSSQEDCAHLVLFADMATRRLTSFLWGQMAAPGHSSFEMGRNIIRNDESHFMHFGNWRVAEHHGQIVGALNGYVMPESTSPSVPSMKVVRPLDELKAIAAGYMVFICRGDLSRASRQGFWKITSR